MEGEKKRVAEAATVSESESDSESNVGPGGEEESRGLSGLSGAERNGLGQKSNPPRITMGRKHSRGGGGLVSNKLTKTWT